VQSISFASEDAYIASLVFFKFTSIMAGFSLKNTLKTLSFIFVSTLSENRSREQDLYSCCPLVMSKGQFVLSVMCPSLYSFENIIEIYKPFAVLLSRVVVKIR